MDNRPIGIFDSGLGGLTAVRALKSLLPEESIIYFGDSARAPYGGRPRAQLRHMARQDLDFVASFGVKAILVACGTVSSNAPELLESYPVPSFGVLRAGVEGLARSAGEGPLGLIATEASIRSGSFEEALRRRCPERELRVLACPDFVPLIESGHVSGEDPLLREALRCLEPMKGVSALLLGCTHYGIIGEAIGAYLGPETRLVEASVCAAEAVRDHLTSRGLCGSGGEERYFTSGPAADFARAAALLLGRDGALSAREVPVMEAENR